MALYFLVTGGPKQGETFKIRPGMILGRSQGEIPLNDPKASGSHAKIESQKDGSWALVDLKSKNGCKVNGHRLSRIPLKEGITIQIGDTFLEVFSSEKPKAKAPEAAVEKVKEATPPPEVPAQPPEIKAAKEQIKAQQPQQEQGPPPKARVELKTKEQTPKQESPPVDPSPQPQPAAKPQKERKTWSQILERYSREVLDRIKDYPQSLEGFERALRMRFVRGVQTDTQWVLGYGPRKIGAASLDLPIYEDGAPDICFEIVPSSDGLTFRTQHPEDVRLNGQEVQIRILRTGDIIQILETEIEVDFLS